VQFLSFLMAFIASLGLYSQTFMVVDVNPQADTVLIEDYNGFQYEFYGVEDYVPGDLVSAIMWDAGTPEVIDDAVLYTRFDRMDRTFWVNTESYGWTEYGLLPNVPLYPKQ